MPTLLIENTTRYVATAPFETVIQTSGEEFNKIGGSNGLPRECLKKRSYIMTSDAQLQIDGVKAFLPKGQELRDVGQVQKVLKQRPQTIEIRDRVSIAAGTELPSELGEALLESRRYPVKAITEDLAPDPEAAAAAEKEAAEAAKKAEKEAAAAAKKAEAEAKKAAEGK